MKSNEGKMKQEDQQEDQHLLAPKIQFAWRYDDIPEYTGTRLAHCHAIISWEQQQSFLSSSSITNNTAATDPLVDGF